MSSGSAISTKAAVAVARDDTDVRRATMRRVSLRLLPFLFVLFVCNYVDRTNIAIAALQMNADLGLSATAYGIGSGIFFIGYIIFEVPSNLILARVGARLWIARIAISWGITAAAMAFVHMSGQFYLARILLGVAEAGFVPGILYYLSEWFPARERGVATARFLIAIPFSSAIGNALGGWVLGFGGGVLRGWQWLFLLEGIASVLLGLMVLVLLTERVEQARWLTAEQRDWLAERLARDRDQSAAPEGLPPLRALMRPTIWAVALPYVLLVAVGYGYMFWAPTLIRDMLDTSIMATGLITAAIACAAAATALAVGARSDRTGERCLHASAPALLAALGYLGAALLPTAIGRVAGLALVHVGAISFLVPFWCLPTMLFRGSAAAAGIALVNSLGNFGGLAGPYLIGRFVDATGRPAGAFLCLAACALVGTALTVALRRHPAFTTRVRGPSPPADHLAPAVGVEP